MKSASTSSWNTFAVAFCLTLSLALAGCSAGSLTGPQEAPAPEQVQVTAEGTDLNAPGSKSEDDGSNNGRSTDDTPASHNVSPR